ncbi:PLP-dependent aminotransferase family protein [Peptacetobacter hiranonis]|uniref:MocR-like pyridoxine biosynthesis transcription factor PdxR n=1 Tax=Peptacetobacter hiranonis TaxID=89152 RepID=UPI002E7800ED|nr:PLP-dependent aminotransferase family protein [Peptacetobacter hiranonis]MEE0248837.1 PLP-dependent aminotransferase family protein [Peptacetobacter hiranonis]
MEKYYLNIDDIQGRKYIRIYTHIKNLIIEGEIKEHEKLPPIRKLSEYIGVNNTTIVKVYELLEKEGYVYKIVGSGTFASEIKKYRAKDKKKNKNIIQFDNGNPSNEMFPVEDFKKAVNLALSKNEGAIFEYDEGLGNEGLRDRISKYLIKNGINAAKDDLQIISGAQQGIDIVCKGIINYSDIVFVEEPTYNGAIEVFKSRGAKIISIPMLDDGIDIGILKLKLDKIKPKLMYVMPNFQNPTGISYSSYKKKKLLELAEEYDFYILEDDFISDFKFDSEDNRPLKSYDENNRVIYIKSFSKIFMPGLRIGVIDIPPELMKNILWAKYSSDISTPGLIQSSLLCYMEEFDWDKHIEKMDKIYDEKYRVAKECIKKFFKGRIRVRNCSGGINFFCELPRGCKSREFTDFIYKKGVSVLPGTYFYDNVIDDRFFRINVARESVENIEKGIEIIGRSVEEFLKNNGENEAIMDNRLFY